MFSVPTISWMNILRLSQWEKILLTLGLTCLMPLALHALPLASSAEIGQTWLPIFYAPLIAGLCFHPHVSILAGLCAPLINHLLFGMPAQRMLGPLTFELVVFSAIVLLIRRRSQPAGWMVAAAYAGTLLLTSFIFMRGAQGDGLNTFLRLMGMALPGILVLIILTEIIRYLNKKQGL